jgi:hypothetical protein
MYKVLGAESCFGGDTQQPVAAAANQNPPSKTFPQSPIKKPSHAPSAGLLYPVINKEVEKQFAGRGVTL